MDQPCAPEADRLVSPVQKSREHCRFPIITFVVREIRLKGFLIKYLGLASMLIAPSSSEAVCYCIRLRSVLPDPTCAEPVALLSLLLRILPTTPTRRSFM